MDMLGANVGDLNRYIILLATPTCIRLYTCTSLGKVLSAVWCAADPAGENDDAYMHKSNELHEAERASERASERA